MAKDISKSLIVGVGGTGQRVIVALKKRLYQRFGEIPSVVKFLSIDADIIDAKDEYFTYEYNGQIFKQKIEIEPGEQFWFAKKDLSDFVNNQESFKKFTPKNFLNYAPEATSGKGAEGIRIIGKMLISTEYNNLRTKIDSLIGDAIKDDVADKLRDKGYELNDKRSFLCFIAGSWAGGAGSGIFKDVADLLHTSQELIEKDLIGFFAMPEFYKDYGNTQNATVNAYTAFMETDHFQNPMVWQKKSSSNFETFDGQSITKKRFNSIYIMQNKLENGNKIDTSTMEDATSAAISNMISVIGDKIASAIVNNHQFKSNLMNKKRRGYSGFGVCEIVLDRKKLKEYILNKVILDSVNEYQINNFTKNEFVKSVDQFIEDNHLDEGVGSEAEKINELIDSLYKLDHSDLRVFFPELSISDSISIDLESSKTTFLHELENRASTIILGYNVDIIKNKLTEKLDSLLYIKGGLSRAKHFSQIFVTQINDMVKELNKEINNHDEKINEIESNELKSIIDEINEKQKGILSFLKKKTIKDLITSYAYVVSDANAKNSIRNHFLERKRKRNAIDIFKSLIELVKKYYHEEGSESVGKISLFEKHLEALISEIALSLRQASPNITDDIKIDLNYFMKKIIDNKIVFDDIAKDIRVDVGNFIKETQNIVNLKDLLFEHILTNSNSKEGTILNKLSDDNYCIESLIIDYMDNELKLGNVKIGYEKKTFGEFLSITINSKISMMWKYKHMEFEDDEKRIQLPEKIFVIGNYDGKEKFFTNDVIENLEIRNIKANGVNRVATNEKNRITLHLQENAVPAFKIEYLDNYAREFNERKDSVSSYFFSDIRFEKYAEDIFPQENIEKTLNLWAIGFVIGLIFNRGKAYYVKSSSDKGTEISCFEENNARGRNDRKLAFEYFINSDMVEDIECKFNMWLDRDKGELRNRLLDYFHNKIDSAGNLGKRYSSTSDKEKEILHKEKKALVDIGLYELSIPDNDFIKEGLTDDELYEHKQELRSLGLDVF